MGCQGAAPTAPTTLQPLHQLPALPDSPLRSSIIVKACSQTGWLGRHASTPLLTAAPA